jgi:PAS domain S-box-containing protein
LRFVNRLVEPWIGLRQDAAVGMSLRDVLGPLYESTRPFTEAAFRGEPQRFEREIPDPAGGPPTHRLVELVPDVEDGVVRGCCVLVSDITERVRAVHAARQAEGALRVVLDSASVGMAVVDVNGKCLHVNQVLCELLGYSAEEIHALPRPDFTHPDDRAQDTARFAAIYRGERARDAYAKRYIHRHGRVIDVLMHVALVRDHDGAPQHYICQIEDLTERTQLAKQLMVADRLASVGTLAAGIAHELNNPLTYVLHNLESLASELRELDSDRSRLSRLEELLGLVEQAHEGSERIRTTVRGLKIFARSAHDKLVRVEVGAALDTALRIVANEVRHRATVVKEYGSPPSVDADEGKLTQLFMSLLVNAAQAIPEGHAAVNSITVRTSMDAAGRAVVEVCDTGCGIPEVDLGRVFDPFFTTKPRGVGTGLGLSVAHGIVGSLGGTLSVESEVGTGTTVRVVLPAGQLTRAESVRSVSMPVPSRPGRARVLVVDDEPSILELIVRALRTDYEVATATNGKDALALALAAPFDAIVSDVMMPEMSGVELHQALARQAPQQAERVVFVTGGAFTPSAQEFLDSVPNPCLDKPFSVSGLKDLVSRVVGAGRVEAEKRDAESAASG